VSPSRGWPLSGAQLNGCNRPCPAIRRAPSDRRLHALRTEVRQGELFEIDTNRSSERMAQWAKINTLQTKVYAMGRRPTPFAADVQSFRLQKNALFAFRREYPEEAGVDSRFGLQGRLVADSVQRLENDVRRAVTIRGVQTVTDVSVHQQRQALLRDHRAADVTAKPFVASFLRLFGRPPGCAARIRPPATTPLPNGSSEVFQPECFAACYGPAAVR